MQPLLVSDSSQDELGNPAYCPGATMTVTPAVGGSYVTYSVPRGWLNEQARVWPVKIDPSVTLCTNADTYISSAYPNTSFSYQDRVKVGYDSSVNGTEKGLFKFDLSGISTNSYVNSATLWLYEDAGPSSFPYTNTYVGAVNQSWNESSTWSSLNPLSQTQLGALQVAANQWLCFPCTASVQAWINGTATNNGFDVYEISSSSAFWRSFPLARVFRQQLSPAVGYRSRQQPRHASHLL